MTDLMSEAGRSPTATVPSTTTSAIIGVFGLALIVMSGCFLIAVCSLFDVFLPRHMRAADAYMSGGETLLALVLYVCTFACMIGGGILLTISVRRLLRMP